MSRTFLITLGTTLPTPAQFDEKNIASPKTPTEMSVFFDNNKNEIAFVQSILEHAPVGTKLRSHYRGKRLIYTDTATNISHDLQHTYIKISKDSIAVQTVRGDSNILGVGGCGEVKRAYPLPNKNNTDPTHAVAIKRFIPLFPSNDIPHELTSILGKATKPKNPFKSAKDKTGMVKVCLWEGSDIDLEFDATAFGKMGSVPKAVPTDQRLRTIREKTLSAATTSLEISPARKMDLARFITTNNHALSTVVVLEIITALLKAIAYAHTLRWLHRDIKPANILIDGNGKSVYLADWDFGITIPDNKDYVVNQACGTPAYLPHEMAGVLAQNIRDSLFPLLLLVQTEIPEKYKPNIQNFPYRPCSEIPAVGMTIQQLRHTLHQPYSVIGNTIKSLCIIMHCYHPEGRPSLILIRLVFFSLLWDEQQAHNLTATKPADFTTALTKEGLPTLSVEIIRTIKNILVLTSEIFQISQAQSLNNRDHHEGNQWKLFFEINTTLEKQIHGPANLTALMSLQGILTLCKDSYRHEKAIVTYSIHTIQFLKPRLFYQPFLLELNTASSEKRKYFLTILRILNQLFQNHPDEEALSLHTLDLFKRIRLSEIKMSSLLTTMLKGELISLLRDVMIQHHMEKITLEAASFSPHFFQPTLHKTQARIYFTADIEAVLQSPFTNTDDEVKKLEALHTRINRERITPEVTTAILTPVRKI